VDEANDRIHRMFGLRRAARRGIVAVAQSILAVKPVRIFMRARQRRRRALEDGDEGAADVSGIERIARGLRQSDIARHGRQRADRNIGRRKRHHDRHGVVGGGVGVDEKGAHGRFRVDRKTSITAQDNDCKPLRRLD